METKTIVQATLSKSLPEQRKLRAFAKLELIGGNPKPHFSLTGEETNRRGTVECCGMMHDELLEHWPNLKPLADIHLSEDDGVPMHAVANAWYWAGGNKEWCKGAKNDPPRADYLASHLRIPLADAEAMVSRVAAGEMNKEDMHRFVEAQKPRWKAEAEAAIALIKSLAA